MAKLKRQPPIGSRPGTLVIDPGFLPPKIHRVRFSKDAILEDDIDDAGTIEAPIGSDEVSWIDVQGLGDRGTLEALGRAFSIHPLALEDVVHVPIRPKIEIYDQHVFAVTRMLRVQGDADVDVEQVSLFVGRNYVLTFQERYGDVLDPVRNRLRAGNRMIRTAGPDYLAYAILDTIIDAYFPVLEHLADRLEDVEERVMSRPTTTTLRRLNHLKKVLLRVRRSVIPQREAVHALLRSETSFLTDTTRIYLRDTYDHCIATSEMIETSREFAGGLMNTYLSVASNRMNEIMKTLTIVASLFVPLTFLAGIYGMNFERMPELDWKWSYPTLLGVMALTILSMLLYFRRKGWLGGGDDDDGE